MRPLVGKLHLFIILFFVSMVIANPSFLHKPFAASASLTVATSGDLLLDLTTQKGGTGPGEPSPPFLPGEMVELIARLTYGSDPERGKLVAFEVLNPNDETVLTRSGTTDEDGVAKIDFRIPVLPESEGTWKATAFTEVKGISAQDFLYFVVGYPVGGHVVPIENTHLFTPQVDFYPFILAAIIILIVAVKKTTKLSKRLYAL